MANNAMEIPPKIAIIIPNFPFSRTFLSRSGSMTRIGIIAEAEFTIAETIFELIAREAAALNIKAAV